MATENEYLQLIQSDLTNEVKRSMQVAVDRDPEVEARLQNLAKRANVPLESVRLDPKPVERQVRLQELDYETLAKQYPSTAQLLADPNTAALAVDDIEGMSMFEKLIGAGKRGFLSLNQGASAVGFKSNALAMQNVEAVERKMAAGEAIQDGEDIYGVRLMTPQQREEFKVSMSMAATRQAGDIASLESRKRAIPIDPTITAAMQSKTFGEFWTHFTKKPFEFIATLGAESGPNMIPGLLAAIPAGIVGGPIAAAAAMGGGSFGVDYAASVLEAMQSEGVDLSNEAAVRAAVSDKALMGRVGAKAFAHASVVGALDGASGGLASKTLAPAKLASRPVLKNAVNLTVQAPAQGLLGALGEAGGQVAAGGELQAGEIAAEFFGEFVGTPGEVLSMSGRKVIDTMQQARIAKENVAVMRALGEAAGSSKLLERAPERFREFIKKAKEGGEIRDVFIPVEQFRAYFQSAGIDPAQVASEAGAANYQEAIAAGTDVVIPLENYVTSLAPTEHHAALMQDIRLHQGDMTLREAEQFESERESTMARIMEEAREAAPLMRNDPAFSQIEADILGQLVATGTERGTAETYAKTYAKAIANLATRSGMDPLALHERYGLTINRPMPEILASINRTDANFDPLLDRMRTGDVPTDKDIFGPSLTEFIRSIGGMRDDGGELRRMEVDAQNAPFMRNLIQAGGRAIDEVTALAREAGYQVDDILDAIDQEVRGNPVYSSGNLDEFLLGLRDTVNQLGDYLNSIGIDVNGLSNEQIRQVMDEAVGSVYEQETLPDMIDVDGVQHPTVNSEGKPLAQSEEGVRNFWRWFGESKVVDAEGRPLVVYHGTPKKFESFRASYAEGQGTGIYFTSHRESAEDYVDGPDGRLIEAYVSISKPFDGYSVDYDAAEQTSAWSEASAKRPRLNITKVFDEGDNLDLRNDILREMGYDGLMVMQSNGLPNEILAFKSTQIKSVDNTGTFDPSDPRILFQRAVGYTDSKLRSDLPLSEQSYGVRYLLRNEIKRLRAEASNAEIQNGDPDTEDSRITGAQLVELITDRLGSQSEAVAYLTALGITDVIDAPEPAKSGKVEFAQSLTPEQILTLFNEADTIDLQAPVQTEQEIDDEQNRFLSDAPAGTRYTRTTGLLKRVRQASEVAFAELGGSPRTARRVAQKLGPFASYQVVGEESDNLLVVRVFGDEQLQQNLDAEPALTFTVSDSGELTVNGPLPSGDTFQQFQSLGWADLARGANGEVIPGWSALKNPQNPNGPLPIQQMMPLLADIHARVREWRGEDYVGLYWSRATGAMGGLPWSSNENGTAVYFQSTDGSELSTQSADFLSSLPFVSRSSFANSGDNLSILFKSLVDSTGESAKRIGDLLEANAIAMQEGGFVGTPSFLTVLTEMRGAILNDSQVLDAVVGSIPVNVMNDLGLTESSAKVLLHDEAVNENSPAFNADLMVSSGRDTSDTVGLLLREIAGTAAKLASISLGSGLEAKKGAPTVRAGNRNSFSQDTSYKKDGMRAYIQFGPDRKFNIALLERADLSSFLHETGHFWLEVMGDLAADPNGAQQIKDDYANILKFLKVESRDQIGVEQHELFARANEAYLREGKAPSPELRSVFQKFKAWLTMIYKSIEMLNVTLTDEVRGVFDRIYASDAEIEAAKNEMDVSQLFATPADAGMTDEEFAVYSKSVASSIERAKDKLRAKLMRQFQREKTVWWNNELDKLRAEVTKEIDAQPVYQAFDALTKGELPDGTPFKLDKAALVEQFGKAYVKRLPRGYGEGRGAVFSTDGKGLHHDAAADLLGYGSGAELIEALITMRPGKELIKAEAQQRMVERHGDLMVDGTIADEAVAAMHNEERANLLRTELLAIRKKQIEVAPMVKVEADKAKAQRKQAVAATDTPPVSVFRDAARGMIGQQQVRDIRPYPYLLAERKASKAAFSAMAKGDYQEAAVQKQRELLNHYLYLEATSALETADDIYNYARKFTKSRARAKFGKAGEAYLEQIDDLLEQYEFTDVSKTDLVRREKLLQFVRDKMADDEPVMIPDAVLIDAQKRNYKTLPFDQLLAVRDAIKNIEHLVDLKTKLLKVQSQRALEELVDEGAASIEEYGTKRDTPIGTRTWLDSAKELRDGYFAAHRKISSLFREMDGWKDDGFMWNTFMKPINDAANEKAVRTEDATKKMAKLFDKLQKPGLANKVKGLGLLSKEYYPSLGRSMSRADLLALALNYGNDGNRQRIRDGYGWTDQQVLAALNRLESHEWDFVQGMWDLIDSYWDEIAAQDKRVNGIAPEKVERSPIILPNGRRIEGGYYPIKYDERHSVRSYTDRAKEEAERIMRGAVARPGVDTGFTEKRAGKVIDRKIKLDLGVGLEHIDTVLQTLTHREMLIDLNRILGSTKINGAILEHYGIETYKAIQEAIVDIAAGEIGARDSVESIMGWLRSGVTVAGMGFNLSTALMQPLGITQSMVRIGPKWAMRGVARFLGDAVHMENSANFVYGKSDMMRLRSKTMNREISEIRNRISKGGVMPKVEEAYFYAIVKMQAAVDIPTWLGAYEKYMEQTGNDEKQAIALADQAVIDAQGGGQTKDLAQIQRGGPLKKLFTTFYSYFSATWNLTVESAGRTDFKKVGDVGRFAVDMLLLYSVPVVLTAALKEAVKGGEGPDDDEEWLAWLAREHASFALGTLVGLRELGSAVQGMYGYSGPAGTRFFSEAGKLVTQAGQGEADEALAKAANNTAGILFHYPAGQLQRTAEGFMALKDGSTSNPTVLIFGPRKDD